jgi:hypothetical protein
VARVGGAGGASNPRPADYEETGPADIGAGREPSSSISAGQPGSSRTGRDRPERGGMGRMFPFCSHPKSVPWLAGLRVLPAGSRGRNRSPRRRCPGKGVAQLVPDLPQRDEEDRHRRASDRVRSVHARCDESHRKQGGALPGCVTGGALACLMGQPSGANGDRPLRAKRIGRDGRSRCHPGTLLRSRRTR